MLRVSAAAVLSLALAAPAFAQDGPLTTSREAARPQRVMNLAPTLPQARAAVPTDDYGYVSWCYGAVAGYVDQYDKAMPEVTRIERAFPTPSTEENIAKVYPEQRDTAREQLKVYRAAMTAAEKASGRPITAAGSQALSRGRSLWTGANLVTPAQLAQFWMGWSPPADCDTRARDLAARATLFGQALSFNALPIPETPAESPLDPAPAPAASTEVAVADAAPASPIGPVPALSIDDILASPTVAETGLRGPQ